MSKPSTISIRPSALRREWLESLAARLMDGGISSTVTTALDLLESVLKSELDRFPLTPSEATLLAAAVRQPHLSSEVSTGMLAMKLHDYLAGGVDPAEFGVVLGGEQRLIDRLAAAGPAVDLALRDAFSRWWAAEGSESTPEGFAGFGLRVSTGLRTRQQMFHP